MAGRLKRAKAKGKRLGRPKLQTDEAGIREAIKGGLSIRKTAERFGVTPAKVQRVLTGELEAA